MEFNNDAQFDAIDYAVFVGMLGISVVIGIYFAFCAKQKQNTTKEYLMGGKTMGVLPIATSLLAGHISGISLMGLPSEMYAYGTQLWIGVIAEAASYGVAAVFFVPVLYNLQLTSSYEYLERRYNTTLRKLGSALYLLGTVLYIPIVMYAPALGFAQMTGINLNVLIVSICFICIFYTTLGGVKAVVWTDTVQTVMIIASVVTVAVLGTIRNGGIVEIWNKNLDSGRIEFFNFDPDPTVRHTFWSVIIGRFFTNLSICAVNQGMVQRYLAMPSLFKARLTILLLAIGWVILISFCCYTGLVIFAAFYDCDPVSVHLVSKADQILPYFVIKYTQHIPALPGIFMAGIFSAALSSMSTCLNSMTGVLYEDFIRPLMRKPVPEAKASLILKVMVVVIGVITVLLASLVDKLGGIIQTTYSLGSISHGTIFAIYMLGMFFPWVTSLGALVGGIASTAFVSWLSFGTQLAISRHQIEFPSKPFSIDGCSNETITNLYSILENATVINEELAMHEEAFPLFRVSYIYYTLISVVVCSVVAILTSWITGTNDPAKMDKNLLCPQIHMFFKFLDDDDIAKKPVPPQDGVVLKSYKETNGQNGQYCEPQGKTHL